MLVFFGFSSGQDLLVSDKGYHTFAYQISEGRIFESENPNRQTLNRGPLYPLVLVVSATLFGGPESGILLLHLMAAILASVLVLIRFSKFLNSYLLAGLLFIAFWIWRDFYYLISPEWLALSSIIAFFALIPINQSEISTARLLTLTILASALVLLQPLLIGLACMVLVVLVLVLPGALRRSATVVMLVGLLPIFLWGTINLYRIGSFTFGLNIYEKLFVSSLNLPLANFDEEEEELLKFKTFLVNNWAKFSDSTEVKNSAAFFSLVAAFDKEKSESSELVYNLMGDYAFAAISQNFFAYLKNVVQQFSYILRDVWIILVAIVISYILFKMQHSLSLILSLSLIGLLANSAVCSVFGVLNYANYMLVLIPFGLINSIVFISLINASREVR